MTAAYAEFSAAPALVGYSVDYPAFILHATEGTFMATKTSGIRLAKRLDEVGFSDIDPTEFVQNYEKM